MNINLPPASALVSKRTNQIAEDWVNVVVASKVRLAAREGKARVNVEIPEGIDREELFYKVKGEFEDLGYSMYMLENRRNLIEVSWVPARSYSDPNDECSGM